MNEYIDNNFSTNLTKCINLLKGELENCAPKHACFILEDDKRFFDLNYNSSTFWGHSSPWQLKAFELDKHNIKLDSSQIQSYLDKLIDPEKNISFASSKAVSVQSKDIFEITRDRFYIEGFDSLNFQVQNLSPDTILIEKGLIGISKRLNIFSPKNIQFHYLVDAIDDVIVISDSNQTKECSNLSNMQLRFLNDTRFFDQYGRFEHISDLVGSFASECKLSCPGSLMIIISDIKPSYLKDEGLLVSPYQKGSLLEFPFCITNAQIEEIFNRIRKCLS